MSFSGLFVSLIAACYAAYLLGRVVELARMNRRVFDGWIDVEDLK